MRSDVSGKSRIKKTIQETLIQLMYEKDYDDITATEIITRSTYSKASFYRLYYDKLDVAQALIHGEVSNYVRLLVTEMERNSEIIDEWKYNYQMMLGLFNYIYENRQLYHLILNDKFTEMPLDYFCDECITLFKKVSSFYVTKEFDEGCIDLFYYCYTYLVLRYLTFWDKQDFCEEANIMAEKVANLCRMTKPGTIFQRKPD